MSLEDLQKDETIIEEEILKHTNELSKCTEKINEIRKRKRIIEETREKEQAKQRKIQQEIEYQKKLDEQKILKEKKTKRMNDMFHDNKDIFAKINCLHKKNQEISKIIVQSTDESEKNIELIFEEGKKISDKCIHNLDLIDDADYEHEHDDDCEEDCEGDPENVHSIRCLHNHNTKNMSEYYVINIFDDDGNNIVEDDGEIICYYNIDYQTNITELDKEICQKYIEHNEKLGRDIEKLYRCKYCLQLLFCNCGNCNYNSINWESAKKFDRI